MRARELSRPASPRPRNTAPRSALRIVIPPTGDDLGLGALGGWGEDGPAAPAVGDVAGAPAVASRDVPGAPALPHLPRATGRPTGAREVTGEPTRTDLGPPTQEVPRPRVEATATHRVEQPHTRADGGEQDPDAPATADVATQPPGTEQARPQLRTGLALVVLGLLMMLASLLLVLV